MPLEVNLVNLLYVLQTVTEVDNLCLHLGVPKHELDKIRRDFRKTDERKREMLQWWLDHAVHPTWGTVVSALQAVDLPLLADTVTVVSQCESLHGTCEEESQRWEGKTDMPLEVNLVNLLDVLQKVTDVDDLGLHLGVPKHELDKIRQDLHTTDEQKREMLQWWLDHTLNPTWERVIWALRVMGKPVLADAVAEVSKRGSLYEPPREDLQKWEEKIDSFDQKLQEVQQRSEHLEREWEKGEEEWRIYLIKLKNIEKDWEDLVKSQRTERALLTLGISLIFRSNSETLQQYLVMEQKVQRHIARSKELKEFFEKAMLHQHRLQDNETQLMEWEKALLEHEVELQKCINQMDELGDKFSGEAKYCRKRLEKSSERLQTCKNKMRECREELTKSHRQLQKCKEKLIECEVSLRRCRDELGNNHLQITNCIEGLKMQSEKLSKQIKALTVTAGGVVGTAGGSGVGALIGILAGPVGVAIGAAIGAAIGLGVGGVGGGAVAHVRGKSLEEARSKLRECEEELSDCSNVVKRCKEVLQKSEDELKDLKKTVSELEEFFLLKEFFLQ